MYKFKKYVGLEFAKNKVISLVDTDSVDVFVDALYAKLKSLNSEIKFEVEHGKGVTTVIFELGKLQPFYIFQIEQAAKVANFQGHAMSHVRKGDKIVIRIIT